MVRGPASILIALGLPLVALAYFLCAGALPGVGAGDRALLAYCAAGVVAAAAVVLCVAWANAPERIPVALVALLLAGAALVIAVMDGSGAGASASVAEAVGAAALGVLLARALVRWIGPVSAIVVPVFVAVVDAVSVAVGPSSRLADGHPRGAAELSMDLPSWGHALAGPAGRLGLSDAVFVAAFMACALRLGLRAWASALGMLAGLLGTMAISIEADRAIPALPLVAIGFLAPNADRLGRIAVAAARAQAGVDAVPDKA